MHYRIILSLMLVLLVGCGTQTMNMAPAATTSITIPATSTEIRAVVASSPTTPVPPQTPPDTAITQASSLPDGWHSVVWQEFNVPLPPEAKSIISSPNPAPEQINDIPVLIAGIVEFPPPPTPVGGAIGEPPVSPTLTLLQFSGTLEEWIDLEDKAIPVEGGGVLDPIEPLIVAGREALHYHRTVSGFNYNDYYVLKPTETTLLVIYTDKDLYGPLVNELAFATP